MGEAALAEGWPGLAAEECFALVLNGADPGAVPLEVRHRAKLGLLRCSILEVIELDPGALLAGTVRALLQLHCHLRDLVQELLGTPGLEWLAYNGVELVREGAEPLLRGNHIRFVFEHLAFAAASLEALGLIQNKDHLESYMGILFSLAENAVGTPACQAVLGMLDKAAGILDEAEQAWKHTDVPLVGLTVTFAQESKVALQDVRQQFVLANGLGATELTSAPKTVTLLLKALQAPVQGALKRQEPSELQQNLLTCLESNVALCRKVDEKMLAAVVAFKYSKAGILEALEKPEAGGAAAAAEGGEAAGAEEEGAGTEGGGDGKDGAAGGAAGGGAGPADGEMPLSHCLRLLEACKAAQDEASLDKIHLFASSLELAQDHISHDILAAAAIEIFEMVSPFLKVLPDNGTIFSQEKAVVVADILKAVHRIFQLVDMDDCHLRLQLVAQLGLVWNPDQFAVDESAAISGCLKEALHSYDAYQTTKSLHIPSWISIEHAEVAFDPRGIRSSQGNNRSSALLHCLYTDVLSVHFKIEAHCALAARPRTGHSTDLAVVAQKDKAAWKRVFAKLEHHCGKNLAAHVLVRVQMSYHCDTKQGLELLQQSIQYIEKVKAHEKGESPVMGLTVGRTTGQSAIFSIDKDAVLKKFPQAAKYTVHVKPATGATFSNVDEEFDGAGDVVSIDSQLAVSGLSENEMYRLSVEYFDAAGKAVKESQDTVAVCAATPLPSELLWGYVALAAAHGRHYPILSTACKKIFYHFVSSKLYSSPQYAVPSDGLQIQAESAQQPLPLLRVFASIILTISYNVELSQAKMDDGAQKEFMELLQQKQALMSIEAGLYLNAPAYVDCVMTWIAKQVHANLLSAPHRHSILRILLSLHSVLGDSPETYSLSLQNQIVCLSQQLYGTMGLSNEGETAAAIEASTAQLRPDEDHVMGVKELVSFLKKEPVPSDDPGAKILNALNSAGDADACMGMIEAAGGAWFHRGVELSARVAEKCSPSLSRAEEEGSAAPLKMLGLIAEKYGESDIARTDALLEEMGEEPDAKARDRAFVGKWLVAHLRRTAHKAHAVKSLGFEAGWLSRYLSLADMGYTPPEEPADPPPAPAEGEEEGAEAEAEAAAARPLTVATLLASAAQFAAFAGDEVESVNIILNFWNRALQLKQRGTEHILSKDTVCNLLTVCETLRGNIGELQKDGQVLDCGMQFLSLAAEMLMAAGMYASLAGLLADLIDHLPPKSMVASLALLDTVGGVAGVPEGVLASRDATMEKLFLEDLLYMKLAKCRTLLLENFKEQESFAATIKVTTVKYKNLAKSLLSHNNIPLLAQCLNDLGDIYAAQDDYPAAAVEWNRCIDTICGKHESVHKWRAMFAAHKLIQKCSSSTCLLACNVLGKLMKYCCRTNLRGKVEYGLMAAEIVKGMVPDATVVQVLCHGLPQLQSGIFVTKEMLRDLKSCSVEELYGSFGAIGETLLDKDACREVLPIALLMEHLAFQLIKDQEKVVHAATLKVKAMAQLGYLHRASIYLQDLMAGQSVAGFHYHRGVVAHQNLASKVTHKVFDDTKNLTDAANLEVFQAIAKLPVQAAVEEAVSKNAVNKIKLAQAEWVLKVCECCLNSPATQTATATPKADGANLAKVKEVLGETLALVETVLEDSVVEDAPAEAEPPAESAPEGDGDGDVSPAAEAPTVNVALEANHLHAFLLLLAGKGLAGKVADVFGVAKRLVAYLRKLDKAMQEAEPTVELVTLSAACWLKCRVALAMAYFCVGSHAHCIAVCETASAEASALQDYDTMATLQAVLANVEVSDGEIEAALGRLTQACQLVAGAGNASKSLLLNLISIGDIQSKLGNMAEASRAWLAAEALLRASPDAALTLKENVYHPEMGTAYAPFPFLYAATMLRASLASTLAGDDARASKQLAETMSIVENASNMSPHIWATALALSAVRADGSKDAVLDVLMQAIKWAQYDLQYPVLHFCLLEGYKRLAADADGGDGAVSRPMLQLLQRAAEVAAAQKDVGSQERARPVLEATLDALLREHRPAPAAAEGGAIHPTAAADPKEQLRRWVETSVAVGHRQASVFGSPALFGRQEYQHLANDSPAVDIADCMNAVQDCKEANAVELPAGSVVCQWDSSRLPRRAQREVTLLGGVALEAEEGEEAGRVVPIRRTIDVGQIAKFNQLLLSLEDPEAPPGLTQAPPEQAKRDLETLSVALAQWIFGHDGPELQSKANAAVAELPDELAPVAVAFLSNLFKVDLGASLVSPAIGRWFASCASVH